MAALAPRVPTVVGLDTRASSARGGDAGLAMQLTRSLTTQLDVLTAGGEPTDVDLHALLTLLVEELTQTVPSFCGLSVTVPSNDTLITLTAMEPHTASCTSLMFSAGHSDPGAHVVFYASEPGAFSELAGTAKALLGAAGDLVIDVHLPPPPDGDSVTDRSDIDQAVGALLVAGHDYRDAVDVLDQRAADSGVTRAQAARTILAATTTRQPAD